MYFIKILIITIFLAVRPLSYLHNLRELSLPPSVAVFLCLYEKTAHPSRADGRTKNTK